MKKVFRHLREFWGFYFIGLVVAYFLVFGALASYLDKNYTRELTCTIKSSNVEVRMGNRGGASYKLNINTEECDSLTVYKTVQRGADFDDISEKLEPGNKYIFTINKYDFLSAYGIVSSIRDASGGEIDFSPQD